jgi:hypothetical protein
MRQSSTFVGVDFRVFNFNVLQQRTLRPVVFPTELHLTFVLALDLLGHPPVAFLQELLAAGLTLPTPTMLHVSLSQ